MKKFRLLSVFLMLVTLTGLIGCSEDETELLNGGQGTDGSVQLNINYTIPGQDAKVFSATYVTADAVGDVVTINAENEDTGESLVITFGNQLNKAGAFDNATVTYIDPSGNEFSALSPFTNLHTGAVKLQASTTDKTLTGVFSFIGYDADATVVTDGVPFYSGTFINVPYTGTLPEPIPFVPPIDTFMKATVDGTLVDFATASTSTAGAKTNFIGNNTDPVYSITLTFNDNTTIDVGTFPIDLGDDVVNATVTIGASTYMGVGGSLIITNITDNIVTGTFTITGESGEGNIEVTEGSFKLPKQ